MEDTIRRQWSQKALCDFRGKEYTYADLAENIEQFRLFFAACGIRKGEKIAICARNSARWAMTFWGVNVYGCVAVPLLADFHPKSITALVNHSESILLFTDADIWKKLRPEEMPALRAVINIQKGELLWFCDKVTANA